jgi:hypothetical protein
MDCGEKRMNPVIQEDVTGCGIACVAALAGTTYLHGKKVAARLGIHIADSRLFSDTAFVRTLLKQYGIEATPQEQPFCSWKTLPPLALLAINGTEKGITPSGIGWCFGKGLTERWCLIQSDLSKTMSVPILEESNPNDSSRSTPKRSGSHDGPFGNLCPCGLTPVAGANESYSQSCRFSVAEIVLPGFCGTK